MAINIKINMMNPFESDEDSCYNYICPKLSFQHRLIGFVACGCIGYLLSFIGSMTLFTGDVTTFAILYVMGNVIALCATGFLFGPRTHCKKMWDPCRRWSTTFYLSMLLIVFCVAVTHQNVFLVIFLLIIQILAGIWYAASYILGGRAMITAFLKSTCCGPCFKGYENVKNTISPEPTLLQKAGITEQKSMFPSMV